MTTEDDTLTLQMKFHSTTKCRLDQETQTATFVLNYEERQGSVPSLSDGTVINH